MIHKKIDLYNLILDNDKINIISKKYPYNLNNKDNIIFTKNELELEYIKDYYQDKQKNKSGSSEKSFIYIYI
jgi:NAD(P)H-hydrate repair Nnr-like enzyme with NAD(P)H-hydrate dehydratase domain